MRLHPKLLLASALIATVMIPVQLFLSAVGVLVLKMAGGAATDTSLVVTVAAIAVSDFWGGGIVYMLTRAERRNIVMARHRALRAASLRGVDLWSRAPAFPFHYSCGIPSRC